MRTSVEADWQTIDTPFEFTMGQVNAWGVPSDVRDRYTCRITHDDEKNTVELAYIAPEEFFDPALVKMYPQIWTGNKFGNAPTGNPKLPERLGNIDKLPVTMKCKEFGVIDAERNIAFEAFFHSGLPITGPGHPSGQSNKVYELMVWFARPASNIVPSPSLVAVLDIGGITFDVYTKANYIAFIAQNETKELKDFDFMEFIHETNVLAMDGLADQIDADWQISALEMGVEVWSGEGVLEISQFDTDVVTFGMTDNEQPVGGIVTPVELQSGLINLLERTSHNHILIAERHRDIAADMATFAKALRNEN